MIIVGFIILSYRNVDDTVECILSIKNLDHKGIDVKILLIDNSEDVSFLNQITRKEAVDYAIHVENKGYANGNNVGIWYAKDNGYNYVVVINNDTIVEKTMLIPLIRVLENEKNVGIVAPVILSYFDHSIWSSGGKYRRLLCNYSMTRKKIDRIVKATFISGCCFCMRMDLVDKVGYIDESLFMYNEDVEYCHRIKKSGLCNYIQPDSIIYHKVSLSTGGGGPFQIYYIYRNRIAFAYKHYSGVIKLYAILINKAQAFYRFVQFSVKGEQEKAKAIMFAIRDAKKVRGRSRY